MALVFLLCQQVSLQFYHIAHICNWWILDQQNTTFPVKPAIPGETFWKKLLKLN
jgi:hypothetical protein